MELPVHDTSGTRLPGPAAFEGVTLTIPVGMYGLLGPGGAGGSTLARLIAALRERGDGSVRLGDLDVLTRKEEVRRALGYLPQEYGVRPRVSARNLLGHIAVLKSVAERRARRELVEALLRQAGPELPEPTPAARSGGPEPPCGVALALLGDPRLMIVDEPTARLDPADRVRFLDLLSGLGETSVVLLSTPLVGDAADARTRVAILDGGEVLLDAEPLRAVDALRGRIWRRAIPRDDLPGLERDHAVISTRFVAGRTVVHVYGDAQPGPGFEASCPDLEDVYSSAVAGHLR